MPTGNARKIRRENERLLEKALIQIRRQDYRGTEALRALIACVLELQPGAKEHIENAIPSDMEPASFVLGALQHGHFTFTEEGTKVWLCYKENGEKVG